MSEGESEPSSLDAPNPEELSPQVQNNGAQLFIAFYARDARYMPLTTLTRR